jgi:hypothetical protein
MIKEQLKRQMEKDMDETARKYLADNPMKGTPFESMMPLRAIGEMSQSFKEGFIEEKDKLRMTEKEIIEMVDEVAEKVINKYFEF